MVDPSDASPGKVGSQAGSEKVGSNAGSEEVAEGKGGKHFRRGECALPTHTRLRSQLRLSRRYENGNAMLSSGLAVNPMVHYLPRWSDRE